MYQSWQQLLFLHWKVDPAPLRARLPPGLHLDLFDGEAWLGIIPFLMRGVRPRFLPPVPGLSNFLELNVRTYVHDDHGIPGVWFFSLDASSALACAIARARFHLPYFDAVMTAGNGSWIDYDCRRKSEPESARFRYRPEGPPRHADPGSLDFFLVERYALYAHDPDKDRLHRGRVHHPPYSIQGAEVEAWSPLPVDWDGLAIPREEPHHVCFSAEARVEIFSLEALPTRAADA